MKRLEGSGFSLEQANVLYGQLTGMAGPVINIPMALALSMALSMVPAIAASNAAGDREFLEKNVQLGFRTAMIVGVPCSFGLIILAEPIMTLLYPMEMESAISASNSLAYLAMGVIFLCVAQTMAGTLQGLGRPGIAVMGLMLGFLVKLIGTYFLTGIPELNIDGAAIASALAYTTVGIFNFSAVKALTGIRFDKNLTMLKPLLAGLVMFIAAGLVYRLLDGFLGNALACLLAIAIGAAVYGIVLLKIKGIDSDEIKGFPKGEKIWKLLRKIKLVK
jgi:stage V sporulation protein B